MADQKHVQNQVDAGTARISKELDELSPNQTEEVSDNMVPRMTQNETMLSSNKGEKLQKLQASID